MTPEGWKAFCRFRTAFKEQTAEWAALEPELHPLQLAAAADNHTPAYPLETSVVYNTALDEVTETDDIRLIVVGDNPGKDEQRQVNRRYLVGQSGKIAEGFFRKNPELGIDFRKNVIILNKTPVHTAKTKELGFLVKNGSPQVVRLIEESQRWMALHTAELSSALGCPLWLVGYSELGAKKLFAPYRETLIQFSVPVYLFQHFSMNRFAIDLAQNRDMSLSLAENLEKLGLRHRREILFI
ncbi:MAG: hypothetical protein LBU99_06535 [Spirochaetaceae bacterium]|jgi:hypothetical protein|nr:hypothetical protein [Spirochaetaceae bacterium]